jgi:hypothetical protein
MESVGSRNYPGSSNNRSRNKRGKKRIVDVLGKKGGGKDGFTSENY